MSRSGINKVILVGNLGDNPQIRQASNGSSITSLSLATSESWRDRQNGQMVEKTEWHRVVLFGKLAEIAAQYLRKGSKVYLEGKLQTRKWQDNQGQERYTTEVVVDINGQMQMLDRRTDNMTDNDYPSAPQATHAPTQPASTFQGANPVQAPHQASATPNYGVPQSQTDQNVPSPAKKAESSMSPATPAGFDSFDDDIPF